MLISSSNYTTECFLSSKRLFIDSCIVNLWADNPNLDLLFEQLAKEYSIVISTASMLEVGFGPTEMASERQRKRAGDIYLLAAKHPIDNQSLHLYQTSNIALPGTFVYNPNHHEWYASRNLLIRLMDEIGKKDKNVRKLAYDALIYYCTWNSRSSLITDNLKDFVLLNSFADPPRVSSGDLRHIPIFTLEDLTKSLCSNVSYPENLSDNMRKPYGW